MNRINLVVLLEQLEELVEKAPEIPLTGRVLLDADELLELIDQIRSSVPEEVRRAEAVSVEKDRVIAEGQQKAERIIAQAEEYAARLIRESEIHRQAEQEARRILDEASQRAQEITRGAEDYADQILSNLQSALEKTISVVSKGREELANRTTASDQ
ncbi:MAG TPA: ATPase [Firmicutes bacterium]|jgi:cell division septum initiation protein DivIVA|nr:ATPase [Bacillota bacterium]